ncbi:MAG TPA: ABC transporter substrate-binding protein [Candidatus Limnocylindria bacterium]|nr:ABC transporter substrate-binding protein [Candidatus Limnocylindria bacterium]
MTTRRAFLTNAARLAGGLIIASCAAGPTTGPAQTASGPKRGGELVVADVSDLLSFDPAFMPRTSGRRIGRMIYDPLIDIDPKGNVIPVLAESWETPDPVSIVLHLRKGVKFHDGLAFDAEAVKFHFDRHLDPKTASFRRADLLALDKVTVVNSSTVRLTLKAPHQGFLSGLFDRPGFILSPNAVGKNRDDISFKPAGTGPFRYVDYVRDDHTTVERNPDYWMKDRPYVDRIKHRVIPTNATRLVELRSGGVDIAEEVPYQDVSRLRSMKEVVLSEGQGARYEFLRWNVASPYGKSKEFRQALNYIIDRDAIHASVYFSTGGVGFDPFLPGTPYYDANYKPFKRDLAKAKELLAKADVPKPMRFTLYRTGDDVVVNQVAQILQENYREAGVTMDIVFEEGAASQARDERGDYTMLISWWGTRPDPSHYLPNLHLSTTTYYRFKPSVMQDPVIDKLLNDAQQDPSPEKRRALYRQFAERVNENADHVYYHNGSDFKGLSPRVKGFIHMNDFIVRYKDLWLD